MKICVLHRYPVSIVEGTNPSFPVFFKKALEVGHEIFLVTFRNDKNYPFNRRLHIREINISFGRRSYPEVLFKSLLFILIAPIKVYFLNKKEKFDLIYCDDSFPFYEILVKILTGNKVLIRRGDLMCAYILDKFGIFVKPFAYIVFLIEHYIWEKVDGLSVITEKFRQYILGYGVDENKIYVIEDSLDFEKFKNTDKKEELIKRKYGITNEFVIMYHGTMLSIKGLEVLIRAIPIVINRYSNIKFLLVGAGEELKRIKNLVKKLKIVNYVIFTGWINYDDIPSYLKICDIGIPMRKETIANNQIVTTALLQYWASSKPVIAPKLAAISDIVQEDINGFLFKPGAPKDLASKILESIDKRDNLKEMGENGKNFAIKRYSPDIIAKKMCQFVNCFFQK